jgi:RNA polymerase sigma-70 factor (ECF subfamily)
MEENIIEKSDQELVRLSLKNKEFYGFLIQKYQDKLKRYILRISGGVYNDADDILQDVFIKVYKNLNDYDPSLKFSSWIYRITHNETISFLRKINRKPTTYNFEIDAVKVKTIEEDLTLDQKLDNAKVKENLLKIISNLDKKYQDVVLLRYSEDKDYQEISDILKKPQGTVATLLRQAKSQLKEEIVKNKHLFS